MLYDYARMLEMAVEQWELKGFHRATYEYHAEQCRTIAKKYATGIGYNYEKAVERCWKRKERRREKRDDGILVLAMRKPEGKAGS